MQAAEAQQSCAGPQSIQTSRARFSSMISSKEPTVMGDPLISSTCSVAFIRHSVPVCKSYNHAFH